MHRLRLAIGLAVLHFAFICPASRAQDAAPAEATPVQSASVVDVTPADAAPPTTSPLPATADSSSLAPRSFAMPALGDEAAGDARRTLSAFPRNLLRGVAGVISRDNLLPFAMGAGIAASSHAFDRRLEGWIDGRCVGCGRSGATAGGAAVVPAIGALFLAGRFAPQGSFRSMSYDLAQALVVNAVWTGALKYSLHRQRPDGGDFYSLPSGHTSSAFSLATVANNHYGWKVGVPAYLLASGIGLARMESNRHYLSDVLAGAALGVVVGRTVTRVNGGVASHRSFSLSPTTDPHGVGAGLQLSASW